MTGASSRNLRIRNWESIQKAGFWPFVVKSGILGWGIPVAVAITAWDWYAGAPVADLGLPLAVRLILFGLLGGIAFGATMWRYMTWMYGPVRDQHAANQHDAS